MHYQAIRPLITAARLAPRAWKYVFVDDPELQRRAAERLRRTLSSEGWANTLRTIYDSGDEDAARRFPLLTLCGEAFPITVFPALDDGHNLDAALDDLIEDVPARKEFSPRYHDELKREFIGLTRIENRRGLFNGPAYLMDKFDTTAGTISARPGWYFEMKVTSHGLETELMNALRRRPDRTVPLSKLRKRAWVHEAAGDDPLRDGARRAAGISVAAVVLFSRPDGGYQILLPQRSKEVEQHPGFYHVAPSGIFSPIKEPETTGWRQEFSVFRCVLREYAEELFNYEDFEQGRDASGKLINAPVLEANPRIKNLLAAIKSGQVNFVYCGISVPLLTLRPEIHTLIFVRDPSWWEAELLAAAEAGKPFQYNFEYDPDPETAGDQYLLLDEHLKIVEPEKRIRPTILVSNAAAGIHLAISSAKRIVGLREESSQ